MKVNPDLKTGKKFKSSEVFLFTLLFLWIKIIKINKNAKYKRLPVLSTE